MESLAFGIKYSHYSFFLDHANLRYFITAQDLTARQACWASFLSKFYFDILHISGKMNPADPASRRSDYSEGKASLDKVTLLGYREDLKEVDGLSISVVKIKNSNIFGRFNPSSTFMSPNTDTLTSLKASYNSDPFIVGKHPSSLSFHEGCWWWRDKLYVPVSMQQLLLKKFHQTPLAGHWGRMKTLKMLSRTFGWPDARSDVL